MSRAIVLLLSGSLVFIFLALLAFMNSSSIPPLTRGGQEGFCRNFTESSLTINNQKISVALADTPAEQARGLSGCAELPENSGMLFPYSTAQEATFWMKDMLIPIDIIWIRDGGVVGIEANAPAPQSPASRRGEVGFNSNIPDSKLPLYKSPGPITAVLELSANQAAALAIKVGSAVE